MLIDTNYRNETCIKTAIWLLKSENSRNKKKRNEIEMVINIYMNMDFSKIAYTT